jgi:hypothetical protein
MRYLFFILWLIAISAQLNGQTASPVLSGKISFISPQNIYVKFNSTEGISASDTLYTLSDGKLIPVLKVNNLSSTSCICIPLIDSKLSVADQMFAKNKKVLAKTEEKIDENIAKKTPQIIVPVVSEKARSYPAADKQMIKGSLSAYSYSDFSNTAAPNSTRLRYTLALNVKNLADSKFSVENYMTFSHKVGAWSEVKSDIFNALKIYTLAVRYDVNKTTQISFGRRINPRISSIGAMDGLQFEKTINNFSLGAVVGSRPNYTDYGFNGKLLQYGAYVSLNTSAAGIYSETSLAYMCQMNSMKTDRRFLYFQHSNSLIKNIYFLSTFEVDLYNLKSDTVNHSYTPQNIFNLTGIYLSLRYKMTKNFTLSGSYDSRKNVMYFETYKSFIDRIIESEMRQSFRLGADYRITQYITIGLQSGYRFLKADPHPSKNVYGYLTYYQIPGLNVSLTLSGTYLQSNYLKSKIAGVSIFRDFGQGRFHTDIGYRYVNYAIPESHLTTIQNIGELNIYWQFSKSMSFSVNFEGTVEKKDKYERIYMQLRKRF